MLVFEFSSENNWKIIKYLLNENFSFDQIVSLWANDRSTNIINYSLITEPFQDNFYNHIIIFSKPETSDMFNRQYFSKWDLDFHLPYFEFIDSS